MAPGLGAAAASSFFVLGLVGTRSCCVMPLFIESALINWCGLWPADGDAGPLGDCLETS